MSFQPVEGGAQFSEGGGHQRFERGRLAGGLQAGAFGDVLRCADAGDNILALGIDEKFAVQLFGACRGIAGEGNAGGAALTHVAENHGLDIDRRSPVLRNFVERAVGDGAGAIPGCEYGANGAPKLFFHILRERLAGVFHNQRLIAGNQCQPFLGGDLGVEPIAALVLETAEDVLELGMIDAQHHVGIHRDEAAVAVIGKAPVGGPGGQAFDSLAVEAQIQHRIHHARHRGARA